MVRSLPFLLLALSACRPAGDTPAANEGVRDDLGRAVAVSSEPRRVIPLAPNLTELVAAAGAADRLAAVSPVDDHPPEVRDLPRVSTFPLDLERALSLAPDLLLANTAVNRASEADRLAPLGIPTYFFSFRDLSDVARALRTIGGLLGTDEQAESAAARYERRIETLRSAGEAADRPSVLLLIGDEVLYSFGAASYVQELIAVAGGESITSAFRGEGVTLSVEFVLQARPAVIVGAWGPDHDTGRLAELHPTLRMLPAVREGRVFSMDPDLLLRPGPRLADGAEQLAALLHEPRPEPEGGEQNAEGGEQNAEGVEQEAGSREQQAEDKVQKAKGRGRRAERQ